MQTITSWKLLCAGKSLLNNYAHEKVVILLVLGLPYLFPLNVSFPLGILQRNHPVISCYTDSSLFIKVCRLVDICAICEINNLLGFSVYARVFTFNKDKIG